MIRAADLIAPPQVAIWDFVSGVGRTMVIAEISRLGIPDLLANGPMTIGEIAKATGTNEDALWRTMRASASLGVFKLRSDQRFENARTAEALRKDVFASMRDLAIYFGSASTMRSWADFGETLKTGKNGFERVHGKNVWDWFAEHPDEEAGFAHAMTNLTEFDAAAIAAGYPFGELGTICDVAGGRGTLLAAILGQNPKSRGVLFDAPFVLEQANGYLRERAVDDRVEKVSGNFFEKVPSGCDGYLLKDILHDWDDARATKILKTCRAAMKEGQRLLVVEMLVEKMQDEPPGPLVDLHMMTVTCEGKQRSEDDFRALLKETGFRFGRVVPLSMPTSIVEAFAS
ncbi:MAG TPA: methyltransferase [Polyangiaceae bacterium]